MSMSKRTARSARVNVALIGAAVAAMTGVSAAGPQWSVARQWNEQNLEAIRHDIARPTIHARNLFHVAMAMWDGWAAYDQVAQTYLHHEHATAVDVTAAREETISFAAYRVLQARYAKTPGAPISLAAFDALMDDLGYDKTYTATVGNTPAALGNRIAIDVLYFGLNDGANEQGNYANLYYEPFNPPLIPPLPGNPTIIDPNRWQPLSIDYFIDQSGIPVPTGYPEAVSPEWGLVTPFSLTSGDLDVNQRDGFDWWVYHDPGPPPMANGVGDDLYKSGFEQVVEFSSKLDPTDGVLIDISPASIGNSDLGMNNGTGYDLNPITGMPYTPQIVPAGDYYRILAEFWADGPNSETPPGHWFTIANYVSDHVLTVKKLQGEGPVLSDLEWDVETYFVLGGALHDCAISAWGVKGWYDYVRPISAIRHMCDLGQCSDPLQMSYNPEGIHLSPGLIEVVTPETTAPGERHEHLAGSEGKIAIKAWRGPEYVPDPDVDFAGVGWILAENWWPYQRPTFVSPPFPGYVSGHSTYSRAGATILTLMTGSPWFPGGMGTFPAPQNEFLVFEDGPSVDCTLQWGKYSDAADQCSLSRIYGGIHPTQDDIPGRFMGATIAPEAFDHALEYFSDHAACPTDQDLDGDTDFGDLFILLGNWGACPDCWTDINGDGVVNFADLLQMLAGWGMCQ